MKIGKHIARLLVVSTLLFNFSFLANANSVSSDINRSTAMIAGKPADLTYIKTGNGRTGEITIGTGKFYTVDKAQNHINRKNAETGKSVVAAVNGGYFDAYTTGFRTYAAIIQDGALINGGGSGKKPSLGFTATGEALIDRVQIRPKVLLRSSVEVSPWSFNVWYSDPGAIMIFNSLLGTSIEIPATSTIVYISNNMITQVVTGTPVSLKQIPQNTYVLVYNEKATENAKTYGTDPNVGNSAEILTDIETTLAEDLEKWKNIVTAVSAGPMILMNGQDVSNDNPDFTEAKQGPSYVALRTFAAIMNDGRLLLGSATASPNQLAAYLLSIGAVDAMSLDGGASTMLYTKDSGFLVAAGRNLSNVIHIVDYASGVLPAVKRLPDLQTPSSWAQADIRSAADAGLIPDNVNGAYLTNITRQDFCHLAMRLVTTVLGENKVTALINKSGISYEEARATFKDSYHIDVLNCYRLGIVSSNASGIFNPNGSLTRQQAAIILSKVCEITGIKADGPESAFTDDKDIAGWAKDYVSFINRAGIMLGSNGAFKPLGYYTRQEAVVTMLRIFKRVASK